MTQTTDDIARGVRGFLADASAIPHDGPRDQLHALVALLVERIATDTQRVARVRWAPPARPSFRDAEAEADEDGALVWRPRRDSNSRRRP